MQKITDWTVTFIINDSNLQTVVSAPDEYLAIVAATHRLTMNREIGIEPIKGVKVQVISDVEVELC